MTETEIANLKTLKEAGVKTVKFHEQPISNVPCGQDLGKKHCSGYLVEWVDNYKGRSEHIRNRITNNKIATTMLVLDVKDQTGKEEIKNYMEVPPADAMEIEPPGTPKYRQICDLQGFFLKAGGFLVADVPEINPKLGIDGRCWESTTLEVLCALNTMIAELQSPN